MLKSLNGSKNILYCSAMPITNNYFMKSLLALLLFFLPLSLLFSKPTEQLLSPLQIPFVLIDDSGSKENTGSEDQSLGSVKTNFLIGKYEITAKQYCSFLNAVASQSDPHHLYKKEMGTDPDVACIKQIKNPDGTFSYELLEQREMLPITYVSLHDAQRFCNWLENNCPTSEADSAVLAASTEDGAYKIVQLGDEEIVNINPQAHFYISEASYDSLAANNLVRFRIACVVQQKNDALKEPSLKDDCCNNHTNTESYILWTAARGLLVGCPRMMVQSAFQFFGYDACSLLGIRNIASNSIQFLGAVFLVDLIGYLAVMTALTAASYAIPWVWSFMENEFFGKKEDKKNKSSDSATLPQLTFSDIIPSSLKALLGCGMCQMNLLFSTLKTLLSATGINSSFLEAVENSILKLQMTEIPYVPSWIVYNGVPVLIELGLFLVFLEICHELYYSLS